MIEVMYNVPPAFQGLSSASHGLPAKGFAAVQRRDFTLSREEHMMKELSLVRTGKRAPRRAQTHYSYQLPAPSASAGRAVPFPLQPQLPEETSDVSSDDQSQPPSPVPELAPRAARRPLLGPPRRSYSVMDCEPEPQIHRLSSNMTLMDLPGELHYAIFDFLDPIDSTCLGLANKHLYAIHRRMHGTIALSTRREGPNELEWAWHLAGNIVQVNIPPAVNTPTASSEAGHKSHAPALTKLRVRGQAYCRKCGITRCELHKHIQEWIPDGWEYCSVKQKFGPAAPEGSRSYCYMSKPGDHHRCGRHKARGSKVVLQ